METRRRWFIHQGGVIEMTPDIEDVKRVLAICFRDGANQSADDLERILSFDMGWVDTETAHDAIKALIFAGWIIDNDGMLSPNCDIRGIRAPLGWQPRPSRLTDPVVNETSKTNDVTQKIETPAAVKKEDLQNESNLPGSIYSLKTSFRRTTNFLETFQEFKVNIVRGKLQYLLLRYLAENLVLICVVSI